ncbi:hypothetical protein P775_03880 [Puniceibacterium antarcticum]|uniref:N-acetyltransferase domain-containing protein n=2 Tax=Puniceibacterium antarcticum TaxID=1206336 RepID=A0A2G8RIY7_9RHOB|nr:hypothetical protein P775_03880 [Puniceibacterium antarcticum]
MSILPWGEDQKRHFIYMQFKAQHEHYQKHYPDALWMVVDVEKMPAGRLYIERWSRELRIIDIALLPDFRAKGIGSSILEDLKVEAMESGKKISIHVEKENPAMSLYLRLGFGIIEDKGIYNLLGWPHPS